MLSNDLLFIDLTQEVHNDSRGNSWREVCFIANYPYYWKDKGPLLFFMKDGCVNVDCSIKSGIEFLERMETILKNLYNFKLNGDGDIVFRFNGKIYTINSNNIIPPGLQLTDEEKTNLLQRIYEKPNSD